MALFRHHVAVGVILPVDTVSNRTSLASFYGMVGGFERPPP